jgi:hypothetical protein
MDTACQREAGDEFPQQERQIAADQRMPGGREEFCINDGFHVSQICLIFLCEKDHPRSAGFLCSEIDRDLTSTFEHICANCESYFLGTYAQMCMFK